MKIKWYNVTVTGQSATLDQVVKKGLSEEATFKLRPEGQADKHRKIWELVS